MLEVNLNNKYNYRFCQYAVASLRATSKTSLALFHYLLKTYLK